MMSLPKTTNHKPQKGFLSGRLCRKGKRSGIGCVSEGTAELRDLSARQRGKCRRLTVRVTQESFYTP